MRAWNNVFSVIFLVSILIISWPATAQECLNYGDYEPGLAPVGPRIHGNGNSDIVARGGDILFVATDAGLQVFDVTDPEQPVYLAEYEVLPDALLCNGDYLYMGGDDGWFTILDVSDPSSPVEVTDVPLSEGVLDFFLRDNLLLISTGINVGGLLTMDVTDPASPVRIGQVMDFMGMILCVDDQRAYLISPSIDGPDSYLTAYTLSDPSNPENLGTIGFSGRCMDAEIVDQLIYVATTEMGVRVIDVSSESGAYVVATVEGTVGARGIHLDSPLAYASLDTGSEGPQFASILILDPLNPILIGMASVSDSGFDLVTAGNRAFLADRDGAPTVIDIAAPGLPFELPWLVETPFEDLKAWSVAARGDLAYVANGVGDPILIYDMSDALNPHVVGRVEGNDVARRISIHDNLLCLMVDPAETEISSRLLVYDLDIPLQPALIGSLDFNSLRINLTAAPGAVYMPINGRIGVVDLVDPTNPNFVGDVNPPGYGTNSHVTVANGFAYASMHQDGVFVYDVSEPTLMVEKGHFDHGWAVEAAVHEQFVVVSEGIVGFSVVDLSDNENPELISLTSTPAPSNHITLDWPLVYITGDQGQVWIYDLSNPEEPVMLGGTAQLVLGGTPALAGPWLISPMGDRGLGLTWIACFEASGVEDNLPGRHLALTAFPNPFNPLTNISFNLENSGPVVIEVYDTAGRRVSTLAHEFFEAGQHQLLWEGRDQAGRSLASGTYLVQIKTGTQVNHCKVALVR